jgi:hypothetical protein
MGRGRAIGWRRAVVLSALGVMTVGTAIVAAPSLPGAGANAAPPASATLSVTPTSGPAGTVINVKSVTPCPAAGQNVIIGFTPGSPWPGTNVNTNVSNNGKAGADGSWTASFTVPSTVNVPSFQIGAECWTLSGLTTTNTLTYFPVTFTVTSGGSPAPPPPTPPSTPPSGGCRTSAAFAPVVGAAATSTGKGLWLADAAGDVIALGDASCQGSLAGSSLAQPVVGIAATPDGKGYWLVARDGGIFSFGTAKFFGSTGAIHLNQPIVGMAATPDGAGYRFVAADGGIFDYGTATFFGSTGAIHLNQPIVGMATTPDGQGYWLVARDGGIFSFGTAKFFGSTGAIHLNQPIVGMAATPDGAGYRFVAADGGIFDYGSAGFLGSAGGSRIPAPIVAMVGTPDGLGYWLVGANGAAYNYGDAVALGAAPPPALLPTAVGQGQCQAISFSDGSVAAQIAISGTTCSTADTVLQGAVNGRGSAYSADGFACSATSEGAGSEWSSAWGGTYYAYYCVSGSQQVAFNWGTDYTY